MKPTFKAVDTCAAEFEASTPYYYKTYEEEDEVAPVGQAQGDDPGRGPNRIGQGIEFDYCCVHAAYALHDLGYETIMVNCNPETVSTDYDTSDRLYFEPLTFEDVMDIVDAEQPEGVVVTFGGQTPLKLAHPLEKAGVPIMGTKPEAIDLAEDRQRFSAVLDELGIAYPRPAPLRRTKRRSRSRNASASRCLSGRATCLAAGAWSSRTTRSISSGTWTRRPASPRTTRCCSTGSWRVRSRSTSTRSATETVYIGGVMEHIEEAGIHSGDSACCIPPFSLGETVSSRSRTMRERWLSSSACAA